MNNTAEPLTSLMLVAAVLWNHYVGRSTALAEAAMADAAPSASAGGMAAVESQAVVVASLPALDSFCDVLRLPGHRGRVRVARPARGEATRVHGLLGGGVLQIRWSDDFDLKHLEVPSPGTNASDIPAPPGGGRPRLAHYKGFANGLDFRDPATAAELGKAVKLLDLSDVVVWDGDGYGTDSFSHLIPLLAPAVKLVAFAKQTNVEAFIESWEPMGLLGRVTLYMCPDQIGWVELGVAALRATQAERVICFGGGPSVADEVALREKGDQADRDITYELFDVCRAGPIGREGSLVEVLHDRIRSAKSDVAASGSPLPAAAARSASSIHIVGGSHRNEAEYRTI